MPVGWDEAFERIAAGFRLLQRKYGREAVGVFGGGSLTNEKVYLLGKFARVVLRTPHIDYNGRFCMSSAAAAGLRAFGLDRGPAVPGLGHRRRRRHPARRRQRQRDDAADHAVLRRAASRRRAADRRRSAPDVDRRTGDDALAPDSRHRRHPRARPAARPHSRAPDRRSLHPRAHRRLRGGAGARRQLLAGARRAADRRAAARHRRRGADARARRQRACPHRPRRRATVAGRGQRAVVHQPRPRDGPRRTAIQRLRLPDRSGQRPGRTRARAEVRPAPRLPAARRCRGARGDGALVGHVAGRSAGPGPFGLRAARYARPRSRRTRACS